MPSDIELEDIDQIELSLTGAPAIKEGFIMTKSATDEELRTKFDEFSKLEDEDERFEAFKKLVDEVSKQDEDEDEDEEEDGSKRGRKKQPPFNFEKLDDASKVALRLVQQALSGVEDLPESVADFTKAIEENLSENGKSQTSKSEMVEFAKSRYPGLVEAISEPFQKKLDEVTKTAEELKATAELDEMKKVAADLPGDVEEVAKQLLVFKKALSEEDFDKYVEQQKGLKAQVSKSELFERRSGSRAAEGSAEARIEAKVQSIIQKSGGKTDWADALDIVAKDDSALYEEYQREVRNRPTQLSRG